MPQVFTPPSTVLLFKSEPPEKKDLPPPKVTEEESILRQKNKDGALRELEAVRNPLDKALKDLTDDVEKKLFSDLQVSKHRKLHTYGRNLSIGFCRDLAFVPEIEQLLKAEEKIISKLRRNEDLGKDKELLVQYQKTLKGIGVDVSIDQLLKVRTVAELEDVTVSAVAAHADRELGTRFAVKATDPAERRKAFGESMAKLPKETKPEEELRLRMFVNVVESYATAEAAKGNWKERSEKIHADPKVKAQLKDQTEQIAKAEAAYRERLLLPLDKMAEIVKKEDEALALLRMPPKKENVATSALLAKMPERINGAETVENVVSPEKPAFRIIYIRQMHPIPRHQVRDGNGFDFEKIQAAHDQTADMMLRIRIAQDDLRKITHTLALEHGIDDIYIEGMAKSSEHRIPQMTTYDRGGRLYYQDERAAFGKMLADYKKDPTEERKADILRVEKRLQGFESQSCGLLASSGDLYRSGYIKNLRGLEDADALEKAAKELTAKGIKFDYETVLEARERCMLDIVAAGEQNGDKVAVIVLGAAHDLKNNVEDWNKANPDRQIALTVVTPRAVAKSVRGYIPKDPKDR